MVFTQDSNEHIAPSVVQTTEKLASMALVRPGQYNWATLTYCQTPFHSPCILVRLAKSRFSNQAQCSISGIGSGSEANLVNDGARGGGGLPDLPRPALGMATHCPGDVVAEKYAIVSVLGQGGLGTTYEAECLGSPGQRVALKAISLRNMKGWKELELFEREARVLKTLQHPGIPEYVDYFEVDEASDRSFYIAQRVARGRTLAQLVQAGWRASEEEVRRIAIEVLEVVQYLGSRRPAVIHRDLKPENIILEEADDRSRVKVVDFGGVQDAASSTLTAWSSTVAIVGTWGYMAPEQFQNRATLQTDLYGVGATLLFLLSGRPPLSFSQKRLKLDFRDAVAVSPELADIVEKLLEPAPEDRFRDAEEAIAALRASPMQVASRAAVGTPSRWKQPAGSRVGLQTTQQGLEISIPAGGLSAEMAGTGSFAVAWNAFLVCWTGLALTGGAPLMAAVSLPFWVVGAGLARSTLQGVGEAVTLYFPSNVQGDFTIRRSMGPWELEVVRGRLADVSSLELVIEGELNGRPLTACQIGEGVRSHTFGAALQAVEKDWLLQELSTFLGLPALQPKKKHQGNFSRLEQEDDDD